MIRTHPLFAACAAAVALFAATAHADLAGIAPADFERGATFSVAGYGAARPALTNFPVLVRIAEDSPSGFSYSQLQLQDGADLCFVGMDGNGLPFEIDTWDPQGTSLVWVTLPILTNGSAFAMCWGGTRSGKDVCAGNPFAGYKGVWHMNSVDPADSSPNGNNGTRRTDNLSVVAGRIGDAVNVPRTSGSDGITCGNDIPNSELAGGFTIEGWCRPTQYSDLGAGAAMFGKDGFVSLRVTSKTRVTLTTPGKKDHYVEPSGGFPDAGAWWHFAATFKVNTNPDGLHFYVNGQHVDTQRAYDATNKLTATELFLGNNQWNQAFKGDLDELRLSAGLRSADWIAASYAAQGDPAFLTVGESRPIDSGAPTVSVPEIVRNADGSFTVSVVVSENDAADGSVKCLAAGTEFEMSTTNDALPKTYAATLSGVPASTTLVYSVQARSQSVGGETLHRNGPETFYTGDLAVSKIADGDEDGLVPGVFRISRADTGPALPVAFTLGGTAVEGVSYRTMAHTATIPAGTNAVDVAIQPLIDPLEQSRTVELTLSPGLYGISASAGSASLAIANLELPADRNTWIAAEAGLASEGSNWSFNHAPLASEHVLFDGRFSNADCTWDETATHEVAAWTQNNGYTGTVTVCTVFPGKGAFTNLVVAGAMTIDAGSVTHPQSRTMDGFHREDWDCLADLKANETYRLRVSAGSLHVGAGGLIDARGKGYHVTNGGTRIKGCSHGGRLGADSPPCYGDPREPVHIGLPHHASNNKTNGKGGGAVYLTVAGAAVVDGTIRVDAWDASSNFEKNGDFGGAMGAAGSVFLRADALTGRGRITAKGTGPNEEGITYESSGFIISTEGNYKGTGGRIAIVTRVPVDRSTFEAISAEGSWAGSTDPTSTWAARFGGGSGTVVFIDESRTNGLLVVAQQDRAIAPSLDSSYPTFWRCPSVTDEGDWTFDAIEFGHRGFLRVPEGTRLTLPGGLASCYGTEADVDALGGLRYEGGTLDIGDGDQTISGNWMFVPWTNFVFQADVMVTNGAAIGFHPLTDNVEGEDGPVILPQCSFEVPGDLTIASGCHLRAVDCGILKSAVTNAAGEVPGILGAYAHGGRALFLGQDASGAWLSRAYDSVFDPALPGSAPKSIGGAKGAKCGGLIQATVGGTLRLDGVASVSGLPESRVNSGGITGGAGGALRIVAGRLEGAGSMKASGGNYNDFAGPGGRIAVRLTAPGADFSDFAGTFEAGGGSWRKGGAPDPTQDASAGTVYLEAATDGEKCGTIRIAMDPVNIGYIKSRIKDGNAPNTNTTEMVSLGYGGGRPRDYRHARYVVSDYGRAAVNTNFAARSVTIADLDSFLDLEGNELTVDDFLYPVDDGAGGLRMRMLGAGTHSLASLEARGVPTVYDSSAGATGRIVVRGRETLLILR